MEEQNIRLQQEVKQCVHSIGRWYKFFAVVSIVGAALMLLAAVIMFVATGLINEELTEVLGSYPFPLWVLGIIYFLSAAIQVPMIIYLLCASKAATKAVGFNNNESAARFVRYTKRYWKFYGILTIVLLGICVLVIPAAVTAGVAAVM